MGLFVQALSKAVFVHQDESCSDGEHARVNSNQIFIDRLDGRQTGCYICKGKSEGYFSVMYSCYDNWRRLLSYAALKAPIEDIWFNREEYKDKPFFELIVMSDSDGAIGPLTSRKLASDFETFSKSAKKMIRKLVKEHGFYPWDKVADGVAEWLRMYSDLQKAFSLASDDGFVLFQ